MALMSRREARIFCASLIACVLISTGSRLALASAWNPLKLADGTVICAETSKTGLRDRAFFASQFCAGAPSGLRFFEERSEAVLRVEVTRNVFEKPKPDGADMVSRE